MKFRNFSRSIFRRSKFWPPPLHIKSTLSECWPGLSMVFWVRVSIGTSRNTSVGEVCHWVVENVDASIHKPGQRSCGANRSPGIIYKSEHAYRVSETRIETAGFERSSRLHSVQSYRDSGDQSLTDRETV